MSKAFENIERMHNAFKHVRNMQFIASLNTINELYSHRFTRSDRHSDDYLCNEDYPDDWDKKTTSQAKMFKINLEV